MVIDFLVFAFSCIFMVLYYWIYRKLHKQFFSDNHRSSSEMYIHIIVIFIFVAFISAGFIAYENYSYDREEEFWFYSGVIFAIFLAFLGLIINIVYRAVVKAFNKSYKKKYNEEEDVFDLNIPISLYFDMGIIIMAIIGYRLDDPKLIGMCTSILIGEYLGLYSFIEKKDKNNSLFAKLKKIPFSIYIFFALTIVATIAEITIDICIAFLLGMFAGIVIILKTEVKRANNGEHSEYFEGLGANANGPDNPTKPEDVSHAMIGDNQDYPTDNIKNNQVIILRFEKDIRIIKKDDVYKPLRSNSEINEFISGIKYFRPSLNWYTSSAEKFEKKYQQVHAAFAYDAEKTDVLLIKDNTISGNGKNGTVITPTKIYHSEEYFPNYTINMEHIKRLFAEKKTMGIYDIYVYADGVDRKIFSASKSEVEEAMNAIFDILSFIYGYEEHK